MKLPWVTSPLGATRPNHRGGTENGNKIVPSGSDSSDDERVDETRLGVIEKRTTSHYGRTISVWSPGIRGRAARTREVLAVARNAREQAKENEFLRQRLRELENDSGTYEEKRRLYQNESRKTHTTLRQREIVLLAECAAHEASATQLEKELDRMRAIEEQSAVEAMHLIRKMSRLQTELAAGNRRAHIAEEMLMGFQNEGERAAADADKWRLEAERVETDTARQTELENSYGKAMKVRGFPIYHIPPTDCPRETDISFLQSGTRRVARRKRADARGYPRAARRDGGAATRETETETSSGTATQGLADTGDDEHFGTPVAAGPSTPEASPAKGSLIELFESLSECESPKGHGRSKSDVPQLDGPGPSKGDGVIFLRGRAVRVEGTGAAKTKQRPPPPHRNGWASPARSSFAKKMLAQFEKAEPGGRTPFRSMTSPHLDLSPSKIDTEGE